MGFDQVKAGKDVPNDINVIIEISAQGDPTALSGQGQRRRLQSTASWAPRMRYPINYGLRAPHHRRRR